MAREKSSRRRQQRTCVVCRKTADKRALIRIVKTPGEGVVVDPTGKLSGRGAYLCHDLSCWDEALSGGALGRALRAELTEEERARLWESRPQ